MQDSGSMAVFKVTARDQGHYKGPSGAFAYCNVSCYVMDKALSGQLSCPCVTGHVFLSPVA